MGFEQQVSNYTWLISSAQIIISGGGTDVADSRVASHELRARFRAADERVRLAGKARCSFLGARRTRRIVFRLGDVGPVARTPRGRGVEFRSGFFNRERARRCIVFRRILPVRIVPVLVVALIFVVPVVVSNPINPRIGSRRGSARCGFPCRVNAEAICGSEIEHSVDSHQSFVRRIVRSAVVVAGSCARGVVQHGVGHQDETQRDQRRC